MMQQFLKINVSIEVISIRAYFSLILPEMLTRPIDSAPSDAPNLLLLSANGDTYLPSTVTSPVLANKLSLEIRYLLNITKLKAIILASSNNYYANINLLPVINSI